MSVYGQYLQLCGVMCVLSIPDFPERSNDGIPVGVTAPLNPTAAQRRNRAASSKWVQL